MNFVYIGSILDLLICNLIYFDGEDLPTLIEIP